MPAGASAPAERRVSFGDAPAAGNGSLGNSAYKGTDNIRVESRGGAWPVGGRRLFPALSHRAAGRLPWVLSTVIQNSPTRGHRKFPHPWLKTSMR